jgi:hypothetical protein
VARHPLRTREVTIEGTFSALDIMISVDVQHYPRDIAPVGTFRIGIQHPHIGDGVLMVVRREHWLGRSKVGNVRVKGRALHGPLAVA